MGRDNLFGDLEGDQEPGQVKLLVVDFVVTQGFGNFVLLHLLWHQVVHLGVKVINIDCSLQASQELWNQISSLLWPDFLL